jgi:FtsH-binding integral membrane protein
MSVDEWRHVSAEAGIEPSTEADSGVEAPRPQNDSTAARVYVSWAAVGSGTAVGLVVIGTDLQADEFSGWVMALGLALLAAAAALGMALVRLRRAPADAGSSGPGLELKPGELTADAVTTMWFLGVAGMLAGGVSVFVSTDGVASAALIAGGVVCVVIAAARRVPRGF